MPSLWSPSLSRPASEPSTLRHECLDVVRDGNCVVGFRQVSDVCRFGRILGTDSDESDRSGADWLERVEVEGVEFFRG